MRGLRERKVQAKDIKARLWKENELPRLMKCGMGNDKEWLRRCQLDFRQQVCSGEPCISTGRGV